MPPNNWERAPLCMTCVESRSLARVWGSLFQVCRFATVAGSLHNSPGLCVCASRIFCFLHCMVFLSKYIALSFRDCFPPKAKPRPQLPAANAHTSFPGVNGSTVNWPIGQVTLSRDLQWCSLQWKGFPSQSRTKGVPCGHGVSVRLR